MKQNNRMNLTSSIVALSLSLSTFAAPVHAQNAFGQLRQGAGWGQGLPAAPSIGNIREVTPPKSGVLQQISDEVSALYKKVAPAVVKIIIEADEHVQKALAMREAEKEIDQQLAMKKAMGEFQDFMKDKQRKETVSDEAIGTGSGFVIDSGGLLLTNDHVVHAALLGAHVKVQFTDGTTVPGRVLWTSEADDLALVQAQVRGPVPSLKLADSDKARIGEVACALGNPLGFESVFTCGTITAFNPEYGIQHDAPITNGNSGGPLLNADGEVLGINHMVLKSEDGGFQPGMGFAIPINLVKQKALK